MTTLLTRTWNDKRERDMSNRKPFRTKSQKVDAKQFATKRSDGAWRVNIEKAGTSLHPASKQPLREYK